MVGHWVSGIFYACGLTGLLRLHRLSSQFLLRTLPAILVVAAAIFFGFAWTRFGERTHLNHLLAREQANRDATLIASALWNVDRDGVLAALDSLARGPTVGCVRLVAADEFFEPLQAGACADSAALTVLRTDVHFLDAGVDSIIGQLEHHFDLSVKAADLRQDLQPLLLELIAVVAVLVIATLYAFHRIVKTPLKRVRDSLRNYRQSGQRVAVQWDSRDELGAFIREYNAGLERQDISESSLNEQLEFQRSLREAMPTPFAFLDRDLNVRTANPSFYQQLGLDPETLGGSLSGRFASIAWDEIRDLRPGASYSSELVGVEAQGEDRAFQFTMSPYLDAKGAVSGYISVWQDVTERILAERAMALAKRRAEESLDTLRSQQVVRATAAPVASAAATASGASTEAAARTAVALTAIRHLHEATRVIQAQLTQARLNKSELIEFLALALQSEATAEQSLQAAQRRNAESA